MPRFYFDLHNGNWDRDDIGSDLAGADDAMTQARRTLAAIALDHLPSDGESQTATMHVTDADRQPVYTAVLSFSGLIHNR